MAERTEEVWRDLLGDRFALVELIANELGEGRDAAATRVWAAAESLKKAGTPYGAPLVLETSAASSTGGSEMAAKTWLREASSKSPACGAKGARRFRRRFLTPCGRPCGHTPAVDVGRPRDRG